MIMKLMLWMTIIIIIVSSILAKSWIPIIILVALPILAIVVSGIFAVLSKENVSIVIIGKSDLPNEYEKYIDDTRFEQDDDGVLH